MPSTACHKTYDFATPIKQNLSKQIFSTETGEKKDTFPSQIFVCGNRPFNIDMDASPMKMHDFIFKGGICGVSQRKVRARAEGVFTVRMRRSQVPQWRLAGACRARVGWGSKRL